MSTKIGFVYRWATFGGVERVFLNRAEAFQELGLPIDIIMYFLHDSGAAKKLVEYVQRRELNNIRLSTSGNDILQCDFVFSFDTPEVFDFKLPHEKIIIECHTPYSDNRKYLSSIPEGVRYVVVPSKAFADEISVEQPKLKDKIWILPNFVPNTAPTVSFPEMWAKRPLAYHGRMDRNKNVAEVVDIYESFRSLYGDEVFLVLAGPMDSDCGVMERVQKLNVIGRSLILPPIPFQNVGVFLDLVRSHAGVFISASRGETFGLSAAEAMSKNIPVLLSDIPSHRDLVQGREDFLFSLGDPVGASKKLKAIIEQHSGAMSQMAMLKNRFSSASFVSQWDSLIRSVSAPKC